VESGRKLKQGTYERYINYLRTKKIQGHTEKHHIIPKHLDGTDDLSNIIKIHQRDHTLAHLLLYFEYGHKGDFMAYAFRFAGAHVDIREQSSRIALMNQLNGRLFWNSDFQSQMGQRGGPIGGSANTQSQFSARQAVGRAYGRSTGISNQSSSFSTLIRNNILVFEHRDKPGMLFYVGPVKAGIDVARDLLAQCDERGVPELKFPIEKAQRGGSFYDFLKGDKVFQSWDRVNILSVQELFD